MEKLEVLNNALLIVKMAYFWSGDYNPRLNLLFKKLMNLMDSHPRTIENLLIYYPHLFIIVYEVALMAHTREKMNYDSFVIDDDTAEEKKYF